MRRRWLSLIYAVLPPALFMLTLVVAMLGTSRALEMYDIRVVRKASYERQVKFGRTPVVTLGGQRYAVLGVKYHAQHRQRTVILRNLRTNQLMTARPGQTILSGAKVVQITASQITFSKDSQMVIVGLPDSRQTLRKRWI